MPWWGWVLVLLVVVVLWVALWWGRNNPSGYMDRTKERLALWAKWHDDVGAILDTDSDRLSVGALIRVEGKLDALADAQRRESVPRVELDRYNAAIARLFEVERNVVKDLRTTGGTNLTIIGQERRRLMDHLEDIDDELRRVQEQPVSGRGNVR